ncbi:MAG: glycosyltransferase family 2 protein [Hyphomonadaceae bacterium]
MPESALVSVVVRTQGIRPRLLAAALGSLTRQTYTQLEIVVVEDGGAAAAHLVAAAERTRPGALRHMPIEKQGRSAAGNAGLAAARGALLGFLDEDDLLEADHISMLAAALLAQPDVDLAYTRARPLLSEGLSDDTARDTGELPVEGDVPFSRTLLWIRNSIPIQAALFRRSLFEQCGGFDTSLDALEDWDLWLRYSCEKDFLGLDAVTSSYRLPASVSEREARALTHDAARERLQVKHANLTGVHRFADVSALPGVIREQTSFRDALKRASAAFGEKVFGARKPPA